MYFPKLEDWREPVDWSKRSEYFKRMDDSVGVVCPKLGCLMRSCQGEDGKIWVWPGVVK